jgi:hypothetical protein
LNRRRFLKLSAAGVGAAVVVGPYFRGKSFGAGFGDFPSGAKDALLPEGNRAKNVLEVFLYGGLSCWETLYLVEEFGRPEDPDYHDQQFYTFPNSINNALGACGVPDLGDQVGQFFGQDAGGMDVKLGPFAYLLWGRPDLTDRMRIVVQKHTLEPHEAAVPQALTGRPVGQPAAAGLGAHIQRYFGERADASRKAPFSYVFATGGLAGDNVSAAASTGMHPGMARPLLIKIDNAERFSELLARGAVGDAGERARYDALMDVYIDQYRERLKWEGAGEAVRSQRFTDLSQGVNVVKNVDAIAGVMAAELFDARNGASCGQSNSFDVPGMSLNAARHLLTHPTEPAKYVCVSDIGLYEASGGGGYDTHSANSFDTARNFNNMLRNLLSIINPPGETDPTKLNLDETLIIFNMEFGRTPWSQDGGDGRNHHPYGYVSVFMGGPITPDQKGIHGNIRNDGTAQFYASPAENRAAALLAMGIWPFSPEAFAVSDVRGADSEEDGALSAIEHYLGYAR